MKFSPQLIGSLAAELGAVTISDTASAKILFHADGSDLAELTVLRDGGGSIWNSGMRFRLLNPFGAGNVDMHWRGNGTSGRSELSVGGDIIASGTLSITSTSTLSGDVTMESDATIDGNLTLTGNPVSFGASDSGGVGYRVVRVPN
jgi:hypothetical protein